jgi:colicin import membrane protein
MTALAHDALLPRAPGGNGAGLVLALCVHGALVLALTTAVDWRAKSPDVVAAELWASVPQVAAPAGVEPAATPPAPTPAPRPAPTPPAPAPPQAAPAKPAEPDIAIERAERRKQAALRKKAEADAAAEQVRVAADKKRAADDQRKKADQAAKEQREAKAEDERLARQREENLRRMLGQAGATGAPTSTGTASQDAAPSAAYVGRLAARIRKESVFTGELPDNAAAEVEVRAAPGGTIMSRRLVKSSGHKDWDEAVLRAIDKTARLPPDTDGRVPTWLTIVFRPRE